MNPKAPLCTLHEGYDYILPASNNHQKDDCFPDSADTLSTPQETKWRDIYHFLVGHGLELRPRYRLGWIPSWLGTDREEWTCEDGIVAIMS